ncbi:MAG: hypothetical protein COZ37_01435 [bacterium (Candidatus Ratteibacteria) CG_4_10_14_3_um_filter_41_18]|uniref:NAD kinase n=4 Tax=Candidatus Ratteibacteria TaxID=2979319 RepID=A0A2M7E6K3_9BACT|nr:MAG: hypothetical protein AUJ76_02310 [Candidatus Omnitrophica bacterium CG1_02_41_171]PIV63367.1 MAG: hypothetical protein COS11_07795 [bacterium (Candidatus Ratteibacteria) CG01_land_8_20_14_3_00_40_19]PIW30474.1 MAG: hypothetical protein COW28_07985 [bacterium (Candidatus Ratteibacteria) CG15_BIG_FIL_POST_REV_8_21_14_020_41_12]PIW74327.1 MAG: hypothetical protein CO004_01255 [bacterium (Candidatus Ratteibacteria) CG_4_8_14_3_um_filter_41_36]PIX77674.1 MAG: hypothetical protein COZ37_01435
MIKKVVLFPNLKKKGVSRIASSLEKRLSERKIKIEKKISSETDLVIALGGDGTVLKAAGEIKSAKTLLLGVNLGEVGFLNLVSWERLNQALDEILAQKFLVSPRLMLAVQAKKKNISFKEISCLNEVVLMRKGPRIISLSVFGKGGKIGDFCVDGLIIATPTGSSGHSLSAGGPLVFPEEEVIILTPICPVSLTSRSLILKGDEELSIKAISADSNLTIDGQKNFLLRKNETLLIKKFPFMLKLVDASRKGYFCLLQEKLGWLR